MVCADSDLDLLNRNDLILNLNPPPDPSLDFSWVKPGASSWDWWVDSNNSLSTDFTLKLVDFAAEMGWPYHTIDGGWYGWARRPNHGPDVPVEIRKGFDLVLTSHYTPEDLKDAQTKINYLNDLKEIACECESADEMKARVTEKYPEYSGMNYLDMTVGFFFPAK